MALISMLTGRYYWTGMGSIWLPILLALVLAVNGTVFDPTLFAENLLWVGTNRCVKYAITKTGQVLCGDKDGYIRMFPSLASTVDQQSVVWSNDQGLTATWSDRGLLGMAVDPDFPNMPYIWVLTSVTRLEDLNDQTVVQNGCPAGDGGSIGGSCDAAARLIRIVVNNGVGTTDQILMSGWCSNGESHHVGDLRWAPDGGLYVSGGDGSSYTVEDRGTNGAPCYRAADNRPQGAWRSQWDEYYHGKILYLSRSALLGNALITVGQGAKVVARGLRNPFRFVVHPVTNDLYIGDVGSTYFEEINLLPNPLANSASVTNFGWPCFEGLAVQPMYGADAGCAAVVPLHTKPWLVYSRTKGFDIPGAADHCMRGSVSPTALAFRTGTAWGSSYENRLFWADGSMQCLFSFENNNQGLPDPKKMSLVSYNDHAATSDINVPQSQWVDLFFYGNGNQSFLFGANYHDSTLVSFNYLGSRAVNPKKAPTSSSSTKTMITIILSSVGGALIIAVVGIVIWRRRRNSTRLPSIPGPTMSARRRSINLSPVSSVGMDTIRNRPLSTRNQRSNV